VTIGEAIGGILPLAIAVDISVLPIIAIILMLITPKARSNGPAFVAGWILGLVVVGGLVLIIANTANVASSSGPSTAAYAIKLTLGVLLLLLAVRQWRSRPRPGEQAPAPKWMTALDTFTPVKSAGLGTAMSGVNPKNLLLSAAAAMSIAQTGLAGGQQAVTAGFHLPDGMKPGPYPSRRPSSRDRAMAWFREEAPSLR
jgi:threonine/homoserine/homoserine lactone efflux protein